MFDHIYYSEDAEETGLGFWTALMSFAAGIPAIRKKLMTSAQIDAAERLPKNQAAYDLAVQGKQNALEFLKYRSGRYGVSAFIGEPINLDQVGGWGTAPARDDAWNKYQGALAKWGLVVDPAGGPPMPGPTGTGDDSPPFQGLPPMTISGSQSIWPLLAVAGAAFVAMQGKRRG